MIGEYMTKIRPHGGGEVLRASIHRLLLALKRRKRPGPPSILHPRGIRAGLISSYVARNGRWTTHGTKLTGYAGSYWPPGARPRRYA